MSEEALTRPAHGARLLVKLEPGEAVDVAYAVLLATADAGWQGTASVREADGAVTPGTFAPDAPPAWLLQALQALLRSAWQRKASGHPWRRRLARWRPLPDAAESE